MMRTEFGKKGISKIVTIGIVIAVVVVGGIGALYFSSSFGSAPSSSTNVTCDSQANSSAVQISISNGASNSANGPGYSPDSITLIIGSNNTVSWTNNDSVHHTVTTTSAPSSASFSSGNMNPGATYTCTFTVPGTYKYYCVYHAWMTGTILVEAA